MFARVAVVAATLVLSPHAFAQSDPDDPEMRIQQLEERLRTLTGQNEELQHRNQILQQQLQNLQPGGTPTAGGAPPNVAAAPPVQLNPGYRQPAYDSRRGGQPAGREQAVVTPEGRHGDAFDPNQNPNAPGAPRALGGGQMPMEQVGAPGGREAGAPLDLANTNPRRQGDYVQPNSPPPNAGGLTTLPPSATPRDEFDLGIGYMQRKDYALAEETMRNFTRKYPSDALTGDAQYWLGESLFQRQKYREAAESFLGVTTKYDTSAKAPDALLRLGQSLAALKEKEAACAALGEVTRKYPRASAGVKQAVDREQKRTKC